MPPIQEESADLGDPTRGADFAARLQALERDAWKALYLRSRRLVRGILATHVGYGPELEDLTQQVFATAATLVQDGKAVLRGGPSGVRSWLAAIAQRLAFSERRRRRNARGASQADTDHVVDADAQGSPEARQTLRHARAIWQQLPEHLQAPWLFRRLEHMTVDEIAAALSISAATVKRRVSEADARFAAMAARDPVLRDYARRDERS